MHAEQCPVCDGSGTITDIPDPSITSVSFPKPCHGCDGKGWVSVGEASRPVYDGIYTYDPSEQVWRDGGFMVIDSQQCGIIWS